MRNVFFFIIIICIKMFIVAYKFVTQSKYIKEKATKKKQRPVTFYNDKRDFCTHRSVVVDQLSVDNGSL